MTLFELFFRRDATCLHNTIIIWDASSTRTVKLQHSSPALSPSLPPRTKDAPRRDLFVGPKINYYILPSVGNRDRPRSAYDERLYHQSSPRVRQENTTHSCSDRVDSERRLSRVHLTGGYQNICVNGLFIITRTHVRPRTTRRHPQVVGFGGAATVSRRPAGRIAYT